MAVDFEKLWKKARTTTTEAKAVQTLAEILASKDGQEFILELESSEAEACIEILDHGLGEHKLHETVRNVFFSTLRRFSGKHARLPNSMVITDESESSTYDQPPRSGGRQYFGKGQYKGYIVAVKKLKLPIASISHEESRRQFCEEVIVWSLVSHPNILKPLGVLGEIGQYQFAIVSEWMVHGSVMDYIRSHATNRLELLHGAAQGLKYLHDANLIHGNLKGANILVTNDTPPRACLTDFGFKTMVFGLPSLMMESFMSGVLEDDTWPFSAPEILDPSRLGLENATPTKEADVYAFGSVILQVLTGIRPFRHMSLSSLYSHILSGSRPEKPADAEAIGISDSLWRLIQKCWGDERTGRPQVQEVVTAVGDAAHNWHIDMPPGVTKYEEDSEGDLDSLEHAGISEPYENYIGPVVGSSPDTSQSTIVQIAQPTDMGIHEDSLFQDTSNELPPLPPAPTNLFAREEIVTRSLDHLDHLSPLTLSGPVGIGKTAIALTLLHHDRAKARFGGNRHFMRCDNLENSLISFLERLCDAVGLPPVGNSEALRLRIAHLDPFLLALDGVERILDPLAAESKEIATTMEEISQLENACLLATSRMAIDIPGFQITEVSILPRDKARDVFYALCPLSRSPAIDDLVTTLDFHPLSIALLAGAVCEKGWDEPRLLREWDDGQTDALKLDGNQSLAAVIESALASPTIRKLGPPAQETLEALAAYPAGVDETRVGRMFPAIAGVEEAVDTLCRFYLVERHDGSVRLLSPFRFYFLQQAFTIVQTQEEGGSTDRPIVGEEEHVPCYTARAVPPVWTTKDYHHLTPGARVPVRHNHTGAVGPAPAARQGGGGRDPRITPDTNRDPGQRRSGRKFFLSILCLNVEASIDIDGSPLEGPSNTPAVIPPPPATTVMPYLTGAEEEE